MSRCFFSVDFESHHPGTKGHTTEKSLLLGESSRFANTLSQFASAHEVIPYTTSERDTGIWHISIVLKLF